MKNRLTFYIDRQSPLHRLNPLTKLLMVFAFIIMAFFGPGFWLPTALLFLGIMPLSVIGKVHKEYFRTTVRLLLPVVGFLFIMQSVFHPDTGNSRELLSFWQLNITVEGVKYAYQMAMRILVMISAFILFMLTTHPSQLMSDLTRRGLSGTFAYVITSTLQIIPQMQAKASTIMDAQRSRGLDTEGSLRKRVGALLPLVAPLVFGSLVEVEERAIAIEARAFTSKKKKTFLHEIPDTQTDKNLRWLFIALIILSFGSKLWQS